MVQMMLWKGWCDMNDTKKGILWIVLAVIIFICLLCYYQEKSNITAKTNAYNEGYMAGYEQGWTDKENEDFYLPEKGLK